MGRRHITEFSSDGYFRKFRRLNAEKTSSAVGMVTSAAPSLSPQHTTHTSISPYTATASTAGRTE